MPTNLEAAQLPVSLLTSRAITHGGNPQLPVDVETGPDLMAVSMSAECAPTQSPLFSNEGEQTPRSLAPTHSTDEVS